MFIKKFEHPYLKKINDIDVHDELLKQDLIEELTFEKIKKSFLGHAFLILVTFGYHYFKLRIDIAHGVEEAISARKLNTLLSLRRHEDLSGCPSYEQVYSPKELSHLKAHPISDYHILKVLYFQTSPMKYKKIWHHLFHVSKTPPHDIDSINLYYDRLKTNHSVSHDQIMQHLKKKMEGRPVPSLSSQELELAFKELVDSQKAS